MAWWLEPPEDELGLLDGDWSWSLPDEVELLLEPEDEVVPEPEVESLLEEPPFELDEEPPL